nr:DJ-1/PfpI family protein [Halalkalibacter urbisdiaboli]
MNNKTITESLTKVSHKAELVLSVCTGALILAQSNLLEDQSVSTNRLVIEELKKAATNSCEIVESVRYVDNGKIITSAGVSAGIDMSLYVVGKLLGKERAVQTALLMEYDLKQT